MNLSQFDMPKLQLAGLPDLEMPTGTFGSLGHVTSHRDAIIILATYIYEVKP